MMVYVRSLDVKYSGHDHRMEEYRPDTDQELCHKIIELRKNPLTEEIIIVLP